MLVIIIDCTQDNFYCYIRPRPPGPMYRDLFKEAFLWWSNATDDCITFKPASSEDEDYLLLRKDDKG